MLSESYKLIEDRLVPMFKEDFEGLPREQGLCDVFRIPVNGIVNIDSSESKTIQSDVLRVFTQRSYKNIGLFQGTWENPKSAMRFIDYKSAILIIPTDFDSPIELWCGGKYHEKFSPESRIQCKSLAGNAALLALLEDKRKMLVIFISPRKELYLKHLMIGDENNLVVCDEVGTAIVNRTGWLDFKEAYCELNKKDQAEALVILRAVNKGRLDQSDDRVQNFYAANIAFAKTCAATLPKNPVARNIWLSAIGGL